ncbi:hypothetical protein CBR_g71596 [Chara braunii]|uniref:Uncharacterized protein n=1 Tax=Chara braunii TaxID=69332 RepID=A0A388MG02_CHABU|nr:hypothetical protein CBR_g71596 [Chara braunii]|eukprot:GBG93486.1 hypothetical protein CBR_g71596 [Chara braunii]
MTMAPAMATAMIMTMATVMIAGMATVMITAMATAAITVMAVVTRVAARRENQRMRMHLTAHRTEVQAVWHLIVRSRKGSGSAIADGHGRWHRCLIMRSRNG